jgi:hypothetical protein
LIDPRLFNTALWLKVRSEFPILAELSYGDWVSSAKFAMGVLRADKAELMARALRSLFAASLKASEKCRLTHSAFYGDLIPHA